MPTVPREFVPCAFFVTEGLVLYSAYLWGKEVVLRAYPSDGSGTVCVY